MTGASETSVRRCWGSRVTSRVGKPGLPSLSSPTSAQARSKSRNQYQFSLNCRRCARQIRSICLQSLRRRSWIVWITAGDNGSNRCRLACIEWHLRSANAGLDEVSTIQTGRVKNLSETIGRLGMPLRLCARYLKTYLERALMACDYPCRILRME